MPRAGETASESALDFPRPAVFIAIIPALVLLAASLLLMNYGAPSGMHLDPKVAGGQAEAAGRISVLATAILVAAVGLLALVQFGRDARRFTGPARNLLIGAAGVCALIGCISVSRGVPDDADAYLGDEFACRSFALLDTPQANPGPPPATAGSPLTTVGSPKAATAQPCSGGVRLDRMRGLNHGFKYLLAFVSSALIIGTISCLGLPAAPSPSDRKQALERLKSYLYLSAVLLVCGLAFLGALLRWPGFSVGDDKAFQATVSAILLYWGVVYSIFIAAYYIPVAGWGAKRWSKLGPAAEDEAPLTAIELVKSGAAIFAPALAGLASSLVKL